ncbi:pyrroloquinoline quinone biosynthesis peptide chaperone PqqD [Brucella haematophila]|jgi:pyrroloquinoline quinone biosynthesis protein D|uniref:Pyrroloquinoline quinone biosynthesis peptide chaperone PqqD n=1 Tax=Brucella haematophila TaxID=419474 RepID=A0ABX1DUV8_9HYPH|nr:pyrroloquinoline quinone biosynthesis peptide chaperone PqqD [Brucella haematophila]KAB2698127.1 pyrroloquinoline quinone biosynthesis peptide chaperone PqqD [Ochrobactrum sp. Kaboul]NKC04550.1 pyrroloquinoline quinone biosynthesis peptide chaperone PqqD [Brucella haematophila]TMV03947.1 pyrroloquinoline quinone biosynthesis peptide chaperone PqqD [Brucella haematophila]
MSATDSVTIKAADIVRLARGVRLRVDEVRGQTVLLAPERAMALDDIAILIVNALDGVRSVDAICDAFALEFNAPREQVGSDVLAFVQELANRRMIEVLG